MTGQGLNGGVVFQLIPSANGGRYTIHILHTFLENGESDGFNPLVGLFMDDDGNLFGTTQQGGHPLRGGGLRAGVVFEVSPPAEFGAGSWTEKVIHAFTDSDGDGFSPESVPVADASGALYVTARYGGNLQDCGGLGCGLVAKLTKTDELWDETILYEFAGTDGFAPYTLVLAEDGSIYGTTFIGGIMSCNNGYGCGTVFKLHP
jgi:hypothetical protein